MKWNNPALLLIPFARIYLYPVFMRMGALEFQFAKIRDAETALVRSASQHCYQPLLHLRLLTGI
ncbi:hypothetical protein [Microcoleus sp. BROC3]|uniref:hypothetical protein n=1 Tax=Microcoleus sp. BROC3 TaxID=3055323 RepID=UPI002FCF85EE